jgi:hypothetical protein
MCSGEVSADPAGAGGGIDGPSYAETPVYCNALFIGHETLLVTPNSLWSAKNQSALMQPPFPSHIHDAGRRAQAEP